MMKPMRKSDLRDLDGHLLSLFLTVLHEGSITAAGVKLGLTQSAVSQNIQRLRDITRDPLFVRAGRGIMATDHAKALAEPAQALLEAMHRFASGSQFDPDTAEIDITIAANDFQRDLLLPALFQRLREKVRHVSLRAIPSNLPNAEMLRTNRCDLVISPLPPDGADILQKRILQDHYACYYDPAVRDAPRTADDYLTATHVTVVYTDNERLNFDKLLEASGLHRKIAVSVPNFSGVPAFLKGTSMLATMPHLLSGSLMKDFATVPIPLKGKRPAGYDNLPMYLVWHRRSQNDLAHRYIRNLIEEIALQSAAVSPREA
ncbi:MAG: transcriptional regulator [Hyphomicrobiales bacterium]|nr:transcriptional regulator [Hyphomicrobiales bacterium]